MRMRMTVAMLVVAGCAARAPTAPPSGAPTMTPAEVGAYRRALESRFTAPGVAVARLGGTARLGNLTVRPIAVIEDSRCPHDRECYWAGRIRLRAAVSGVAGEIVLVSNQPFALPRGGTLTLVAVAPEPWSPPPPGIETGPASRFGFRRDRARH